MAGCAQGGWHGGGALSADQVYPWREEYPLTLVRFHGPPGWPAATPSLADSAWAKVTGWPEFPGRPNSWNRGPRIPNTTMETRRSTATAPTVAPTSTFLDRGRDPRGGSGLPDLRTPSVGSAVDMGPHDLGRVPS